MKLAFEKWWRRANTHIPHISNWQATIVKKLLRKAFKAGKKSNETR